MVKYKIRVFVSAAVLASSLTGVFFWNRSPVPGSRVRQPDFAELVEKVLESEASLTYSTNTLPMVAWVGYDLVEESTNRVPWGGWEQVTISGGYSGASWMEIVNGTYNFVGRYKNGDHPGFSANRGWYYGYTANGFGQSLYDLGPSGGSMTYYGDPNNAMSVGGWIIYPGIFQPYFTLPGNDITNGLWYQAEFYPFSLSFK